MDSNVTGRDRGPVSNRPKYQSTNSDRMVELDIGKHGVILLVLLFLVMGIEDILIWLNTGALPAIEFFIAIVIVLSILALAIREARHHPPPRH